MSELGLVININGEEFLFTTPCYTRGKSDVIVTFVMDLWVVRKFLGFFPIAVMFYVRLRYSRKINIFIVD